MFISYNLIQFIMLAALGSLASYAVPKLLSFASKKLFHTPLGAKIKRGLANPVVRNVATNIRRNYKKMMDNQYNEDKNPE